MAGQPTKYRKEYNEEAYKLCLLLNATDKQLADYFEVNESTVNNWKIDFPEFLESIKNGKVRADAAVVKSLHARAVGYSCKETHISVISGTIIKTNITKHYPPDTAAAFIWLKNRQNWTDRKEVVLKDDRYTDEQRDAIRAELAGKCVVKALEGTEPVSMPIIEGEVIDVQRQR